MSELLLIDHYKELEEFELVEEQLLTSLPAYQLYLQRTKKAFEQTQGELEVRPYQWEYAALVAVRPKNIMAYEMGLGKTYCTLLSLQAVYQSFWDRRAGCIHILVPNFLAAQRWVEELERLPEMCEHFELIKCEADLDFCTKPIIIYSLDFPKNKSKHRKGSARPFISRRLAKLYKPSMVVIDEVHNCQPGTQRTSQIKYLLKRAKRVLALTGTPSEGKLSEIHNLCNLVYGRKWPFSSAQIFSKMFGTKEQLSTNYLYGSKLQESSRVRYLQHLDSEKLVEYYNLVKRFIHRVKLTDPEVRSCITIPSSTSLIYRLEPTLEQKSTHLDYTIKHKKALIAASQAVGVKQKAEALRLLYPLIALCNHNSESPKLAASSKIIQEAVGKVVVFCSYVKSASLITEYLQNLLGAESVIRVYATDESVEKKKLSSDERVVLVDRFQFDSKVKVGVFSINLAGESINLTAASDVIYYCLPWSVKKLRQSMYRAVRAGNKHQEVKLHFLYHRGLVDEHQVVLATQKIKGSKLLEDYDVDSETTIELTQTEVIKKLLATSN
jgi:SNF2 family DNA or RNA helicase